MKPDPGDQNTSRPSIRSTRATSPTIRRRVFLSACRNDRAVRYRDRLCRDGVAAEPGTRCAAGSAGKQTARIAAAPPIGHSLVDRPPGTAGEFRGRGYDDCIAPNETAMPPAAADLRGNWTREEALALYNAPSTTCCFGRRPCTASISIQPGAALEAAQHQDRRLPRGLRLLQPVGPS